MPTKVHLVKAMVLPVVMYECEGWIITKAERWRIDAFELWCWRRLLRVPWIARRSNQSVLKEISPEFEGVMLKLKLQYFGHLMLTHLKRSWGWEGLKAGGEGDDRGWDGWMASLTQWTWVWVGSGRGWWTGRPGMLQCMRLQRVRHDWATELNWTGKDVHDRLDIIWSWIWATHISGTGSSNNRSSSWASWLPGSHSYLWGRHWFGCEWGPSGRERASVDWRPLVRVELRC